MQLQTSTRTSRHDGQAWFPIVCLVFFFFSSSFFFPCRSVPDVHTAAEGLVSFKSILLLHVSSCLVGLQNYDSGYSPRLMRREVLGVKRRVLGLCACVLAPLGAISAEQV